MVLTGKEAKAAGTTVGTYRMGLEGKDFSNNDPNYNVTFKVSDGKLTIEQAKVTAKIKGTSATCTYDGETHTVNGFEVTEVTDESGAATDLYDTRNVQLRPGKEAKASSANACTYQMGLTGGDDGSFQNADGNFDVTFVVAEDGVLTINKAKVTVFVEGASETKTYNGEEQKAEGYKATGITGEAAGKYSLDGDIGLSEGAAVAKGTEVGTYQMGLTGDSFVNKNGNFEVAFDVAKDGKLVIEQANTMTVSCDGYAGTYDGEEHAPTATATVPDGTAATVEYSLDGEKWVSDAPSIKDAGEKTVYVRATNSNYATATNSYTLKVAKAQVTVSVAGNTETTTYNGEGQSVEGFEVVGVEGDASDVYLPRSIELKEGHSAVAKGTEAGTYQMGLTGGDDGSFQNADGNFDVTFVVAEDGVLTINKRAIEVSDSATYTYNGQEQALSIDAAKVTNLVDGDRLYLNGAQVKGTEPGTYTDVTEYSWDVVNDGDNVTANYDLKVSGELVITAADNGNGSSDKADGSSAAKTGDSVAPFAAGAGIVALAAALAALLVSRKLRGARR